MALYGMWGSAVFGGVLTALSFSPYRRRVPRWGIAAGWLLVPLVIWQIALPEYAMETRRLACRATAAAGTPYSMCDEVDYDPPAAAKTGPVFSLRERLALHGFNHIMAAGGALTGHQAVAWETLLLSWVSTGEGEPTPEELRQRPIRERGSRCNQETDRSAPIVTTRSDFFLDSKEMRRRVARLAVRAETVEVGESVAPVSGTVTLAGPSNNTVYGRRERPLTLRTALALYVPGAELTATRVSADKMRIQWSGAMLYPPRAAFSIDLPTLHGTYQVRLDEAVFCGLQMDGSMQPYVQVWETVISLDDPRLHPPRVDQNDPGWFERVVMQLIH